MATSARYGKAGAHFAAAQINYVANPIMVVLLDAAYVFDQDLHEFYSDISANELPTANGYTVGGQALANKTTSYDAVTHKTRHMADNTIWTPAASEILTASFAAVFKDTGVATTAPLICLIDFGGAKSADSGPFTLDWNDTDGVFRI